MPSLFDTDVPYVRGSETSKAAAEAIEPKVPILREQVYAMILDRGAAGMTDEEMQRQLAGNTQRPRRVELVKQGRIRPSGTRKTASGREAVVWVAVEGATDGR